MLYRKDLAKRIISDKIFKDRACEIAINPKCDNQKLKSKRISKYCA